MCWVDHTRTELQPHSVPLPPDLAICMVSARQRVDTQGWCLTIKNSRFALWRPEQWEVLMLPSEHFSLQPRKGFEILCWVPSLTCLPPMSPMSMWCPARAQISQEYPLHICIPQPVKDWKQWRPGTELGDLRDVIVVILLPGLPHFLYLCDLIWEQARKI